MCVKFNKQYELIWIYLNISLRKVRQVIICPCVYVCVCVCARACVRAYVDVRVSIFLSNVNNILT